MIKFNFERDFALIDTDSLCNAIVVFSQNPDCVKALSEVIYTFFCTLNLTDTFWGHIISLGWHVKNAFYLQAAV